MSLESSNRSSKKILVGLQLKSEFQMFEISKEISLVEKILLLQTLDSLKALTAKKMFKLKFKIYLKIGG